MVRMEWSGCTILTNQFPPVSVPNCGYPNTVTKHQHSPSSTSIIRFSLSSPSRTRRVLRRQQVIIKAAAAAEGNMTTTTHKLGINVQTNPPESKLSELGVRDWPKWGCPPSKFPWTYSSKETCYLLKGKVKVYPDGSDEAVEIGAGDLVEFPKGMSCTWDVSETVDKHYNFE
ncbi:uncharacterized protein LOC130785750 [Actinidia eriantha]|uniref:uncharacterized protein LOC130785750 n=1 Tax=Actinidia eriantha TaxID=165200 RepID=UPI00258FF018|nr:uncharacterized protein LOC130785750 [Actinidia eriantha]